MFRAMVAGDVEPPPVAKLVGFAMTDVEAGRAVFEMDVGPQHSSPLGTVHGGIVCDLVDAAMGCSHASLLDEGETFTTLELKINFLRPFWTGRLIAHGRVVSRGRTVGMSECDVEDAEGRLIARASSTCMTLRGDSARGR